MSITAPIELRRPRRRRSYRRSVRVRCEAVADIGFRLLGTEILDLSTEGLLLATHGAYARIGEEVFLAFRPTASDEFVDAIGHITRIARGRRGEDRTPAVGISFSKISPIHRALISWRLEGRPPPAPARRPPPDYAAAIREIAGYASRSVR